MARLQNSSRAIFDPWLSSGLLRTQRVHLWKVIDTAFARSACSLSIKGAIPNFSRGDCAIRDTGNQGENRKKSWGESVQTPGGHASWLAVCDTTEGSGLRTRDFSRSRPRSFAVLKMTDTEQGRFQIRISPRLDSSRKRLNPAGLFNHPQRYGVLVPDEDAMARDDGVGPCFRLGHREAGQLDVLLVARRKGHQLAVECESQQTGAGVEKGRTLASGGRVGPERRAGSGVNTVEMTVVAIQQASLEHGRGEPRAELVAPKRTGGNTVALPFDLQGHRADGLP